MWGGLLQVCAYTKSPFWSERNCFLSSKWWLVSQHQNACIRTEIKYIANWPREIELVCIQRLKAGAEDRVIASMRWDIAKLFLYQGRRASSRVIAKVLSTVYTCSIYYQERLKWWSIALQEYNCRLHLSSLDVFMWIKTLVLCGGWHVLIVNIETLKKYIQNIYYSGLLFKCLIFVLFLIYSSHIIGTM